MKFQPRTIRPFIGAKNYDESRGFYRALGFEEVILDEKMCLFKVNEALGLYLQDYYVQAWVNNSMVFLEVDDIERCAEEMLGKGLQDQYKYVRFTEIKQLGGAESCLCMSQRASCGTSANSMSRKPQALRTVISMLCPFSLHLTFPL